MRHHLDLPIPRAIDLHDLAQIADPVVHLDLVVQELLKRGDVEDLVRGRLRRVDDELLRDLAALLVLAAGVAERARALGFLWEMPMSILGPPGGGGKGGGGCLGDANWLGLERRTVAGAIAKDIGRGGEDAKKSISYASVVGF